jgi:hypothetical protein
MGTADLALHRGELLFSVRPVRLHDLSPPLDGFLEEVTSAKLGEHALDHPFLELVSTEAILIALLRSAAVP